VPVEQVEYLYHRYMDLTALATPPVTELVESFYSQRTAPSLSRAEFEMLFPAARDYDTPLFLNGTRLFSTKVRGCRLAVAGSSIDAD